MANRYWRGGSGTWDTTTTTNWSTTSGGSGGASAPTASDTAIFDNNSNVGTGAFTVTVSAGVCLDMTFGTGASALDGAMTLAMGISTLGVSGNWTSSPTNFSFSGTGTINFLSTTTQTITSNGVTFPSTIVFNGVGGSWQLQDALTTTGQITLTNGTLDLNSKNLTCNIFSSANSNTRSIAFGTGQVYITGSNTTVLGFTTVTGYTYTGTPVFNLTYAGSTGTRVCRFATGYSESNVPTLNITAGSDTLGISNGTSAYKNLNYTGFTGTQGDIPLALYGNLTVSSGMTTVSSGAALSFSSTIQQQNITSNGKTLDFPITFNGTATYQLQDALTMGSTRTCTLTSGILDLNSKNLTCNIFISSNSNTRSILFGTGQMYLVGSGTTIWNLATSTNFSLTGTPIVNCTYSGATGTRTLNTGTVSEANSASFNITAGTDAISIATIGSVRGLNFTGFSGTLAGTQYNTYGDVTYSTGMTLTASALGVGFNKASGTQTITTNGKTLDFPISIGTSTSTCAYVLNGDITIGSTSTSIVTFNGGTLNLAGYTLTIPTSFNSSNSNTRVIAFGSGGSFVLSGSGTAWAMSAATNYSYTGTGTINLTSASAKTFAGGSASYPTINQGGAGALTITGSNTFSNITNTTQPASVLFIAGFTNTFAAFSLNGTAGNLITIGSTTNAQHFLSYSGTGLINCNYLSISYSFANQTFTWYAGNNSTNGGNNNNWVFGVGNAVSTTETATLTDSQVGYWDTNASTSETTTITDSQLGYWGTSASASETITFSDVDSALLDYLNSISETVTLTDSVTANIIFFTSLAEAITLTDVYTFTGANVFFVSLLESLTLSETQSATATFVSAVSEAVTFADIAAASATFVGFLSESQTLTDSYIGTSSKFASISETATFTTSQTANVAFAGILAETLVLIETQSAQVDFRPAVAELITLLDFAIGRGWFKIPDDQTVTWNAINNTESTTWSTIDDTQTPGWTPIDNTQL